MMDWIPNRLVYEKKYSGSACASYASATLASMGCRIRRSLKLGALL